MPAARFALYNAQVFAPSFQESPTMPADFLLDWVADNVSAEAFPKGQTEARRLAARLVTAAAAQGISKDDLETAAEEPLPSFLYVAMEDVAALEACLPSSPGH